MNSAVRVDSPAGDERALETLFQSHYASLCEFAVRYVREEALAEEIVQDLFADLWARRAEWRVRGPVRAYLFGAVRNRALNVRKRQATERDWAEEERVSEIRVLSREPDRADERVERHASDRRGDPFADLVGYPGGEVCDLSHILMVAEAIQRLTR